MTEDRHLNDAVDRCCVRVSSMEVPVRELFASSGFAISAFLAVAIAVGAAFIFETSLEIVVSMRVMGFATAIAEYVMQSGQQPP